MMPTTPATPSADSDASAPAEPKVFVKDLQEKQSFISVFLARDKAVLTGKNGKTYISALLGDSTGAVDARIWDNVETMADVFQSGDIVRVKGLVQIFQGRRQVVVQSSKRRCLKITRWKTLFLALIATPK